MTSTPARVEPAAIEIGAEVLRYLGLDPRNVETQALVLLCRRYRLDPLLGHANVIGTKNGFRPYITRDGMLEIAHRSGHFDGMTTDEERRSSTGDGWTAYVSVWRDDMKHPFRYGAQCKDDEAQARQGNGPEMALARAERRALRRAFNIPAYDEEADTDIDVRERDGLSAVTNSAELRERSAAGSEPVTDTSSEPRPLSDETRDDIRTVFEELGITSAPEQLARAASAIGRELNAPGSMTEDEGEQLLAALRAELDNARRVR